MSCLVKADCSTGQAAGVSARVGLSSAAGGTGARGEGWQRRGMGQVGQSMQVRRWGRRARTKGTVELWMWNCGVRPGSPWCQAILKEWMGIGAVCSTGSSLPNLKTRKWQLIFFNHKAHIYSYTNLRGYPWSSLGAGKVSAPSLISGCGAGLEALGAGKVSAPSLISGSQGAGQGRGPLCGQGLSALTHLRVSGCGAGQGPLVRARSQRPHSSQGAGQGRGPLVRARSQRPHSSQGLRAQGRAGGPCAGKVSAPSLISGSQGAGQGRGPLCGQGLSALTRLRVRGRAGGLWCGPGLSALTHLRVSGRRAGQGALVRARSQRPHSSQGLRGSVRTLMPGRPPPSALRPHSVPETPR